MKCRTEELVLNTSLEMFKSFSEPSGFLWLHQVYIRKELQVLLEATEKLKSWLTLLPERGISAKDQQMVGESTGAEGTCRKTENKAHFQKRPEQQKTHPNSMQKSSPEDIINFEALEI